MSTWLGPLQRSEVRVGWGAVSAGGKPGGSAFIMKWQSPGFITAKCVDPAQLFCVWVSFPCAYERELIGWRLSCNHRNMRSLCTLYWLHVELHWLTRLPLLGRMFFNLCPLNSFIICQEGKIFGETNLPTLLTKCDESSRLL